MLTKKTRHASSWFLVLVCVALCGCVKPPAQPIVEQPVPPEAIKAVSAPQPTEMPKLPPPKREEVEQTLKRIFKSAVVIDASRTPAFLVGDFNGDFSQDLAVIVKPAQGKISELNQEFPNWLAREPLKEVLLPKSKVLASPGASRPVNTAAGQTVRFEQSDVLLAIIHGSGPKGWRDPEATQTHLLRDVVGTNMKALASKDAATVYKGVKPFPVISGDLIQETLIGQSGFLHINGGIYAWYDPKNYNAVSATTAHAGMSAMSGNPKSRSPNPVAARR
jgi:hypothetical protein